MVLIASVYVSVTVSVLRMGRLLFSFRNGNGDEAEALAKRLPYVVSF